MSDEKKGGKAPARTFRKLSNVEHVRLRTGMWLGQNSQSTYQQHFMAPRKKGGYDITHEEITEVPAKLKCLDEAVMNCVDEYNRNQNDRSVPKARKMDTLEISLGDDRRRITVADNGRGIPAANAEGVFLHLMYGENFDDEVRRDHVAGQNGVGISLVRIVSAYFKTVTHHDKTSYYKIFTPTAAFLDGARKLKFSPEEIESMVRHFEEHGTAAYPGLEEKRKKPLLELMEKTGLAAQIKKNPERWHGTAVTFELDPKFFNGLDVSFDLRLLSQYLQDIAMSNPGLKVVLKHKKEKTVFHFEHGFEDLFEGSETPYFRLLYKGADPKSGLLLESFFLPGEGKNLTWVNSNFASLGGSAVEYLENRVCDEVRKKPAIQALEKRLKTDASRRDVRACFHMISNWRLLNPRFRSQDKSYLINDLNEEIRQAVDKNLDKLIKELDLVNEVKIQMEKRVKMKDLEDASRDLRKAGRMVIPKLIPCTGGDEEAGRTLFIAEGDSAIAGLRPVRDPRTHALFPLRGKPLNVKGMSLARAVQNEEIKNLVAILNLPLTGKLESKESVGYERIAIITDADYDGYAIRSLMVSFFYEYWPDLFRMGLVYLCSAPLFEVEVQNPRKEKKVFFCIDDGEYDKLVKKVKETGSVMVRKKRNKGLGETGKEAMRYTIDHCMSRIDIKNEREAKKTQELWFHRDFAEDRRKAISEYAALFFEA
ncbi:MAG: DNA gyrase subunit B [Spirochaetes bacterium]|nr:DNA gyrase subunit B [Spirochaetota bacterium]